MMYGGKMSKKIDLKACPAFQALSLQHRKFVLEYLKDSNATQAATRAGYSKKTANQQGPRLLVNVGIKKALAEITSQIAQGDIADIEEVARFLTLVMRGNIKQVASWREDGLTFTTSNSDDLDDDTSRLIKRVKVTEKTSQKGDWTECKTEVELHDPLKAAELIGRYLGMWKDKVEIPGLVDYMARLEAARVRSREMVNAHKKTRK